MGAELGCKVLWVSVSFHRERARCFFRFSEPTCINVLEMRTNARMILAWTTAQLPAAPRTSCQVTRAVQDKTGGRQSTTNTETVQSKLKKPKQSKRKYTNMLAMIVFGSSGTKVFSFPVLFCIFPDFFIKETCGPLSLKEESFL